jgi:hypothetical protein
MCLCSLEGLSIDVGLAAKHEFAGGGIKGGKIVSANSVARVVESDLGGEVLSQRRWDCRGEWSMAGIGLSPGSVILMIRDKGKPLKIPCHAEMANANVP